MTLYVVTYYLGIIKLYSYFLKKNIYELAKNGHETFTNY